MDQHGSHQLAENGQILLEIDSDNFIRSISKLCDAMLENRSANGATIPSFQLRLITSEGPESDNQIPVSDRLLLGFKEAAKMLSMTEQALRDLIHKGQGPETVKRGKRVCFTHEGLNAYVANLPREQSYHGIIETINAAGAKPLSIEERRVFGT